MSEPAHEQWYERRDADTGEIGLRFSCTMCGACCTGPEGIVILSDDETRALARRLAMPEEAFIDRYTHQTPRGRSLIETDSTFGKDCIFLDRAKIPGKAVCGVYEDRPSQCRTWPFWNSNLINKRAWVLAGRKCPGIDKGTLYTPLEISARRAVIDM